MQIANVGEGGSLAWPDPPERKGQVKLRTCMVVDSEKCDYYNG